MKFAEVKVDTSKVRIKIGEHEFEAEGNAETVQAQFLAFQAIISSMPSKGQPHDLASTPQVQEKASDAPQVALARIMRVQGRVVSLTAIPASLEDAALLIMLGNLELRNNEASTGQEIGDGLAQSGRPVPRTDRVVGKLMDDAFVLKSGIKRSSRYRLSNSGHQKALAVARELIGSLP